jgi:hypothetical protein
MLLLVLLFCIRRIFILLHRLDERSLGELSEFSSTTKQQTSMRRRKSRKDSNGNRYANQGCSAESTTQNTVPLTTTVAVDDPWTTQTEEAAFTLPEVLMTESRQATTEGVRV